MLLDPNKTVIPILGYLTYTQLLVVSDHIAQWLEQPSRVEEVSGSIPDVVTFLI